MFDVFHNPFPRPADRVWITVGAAPDSFPGIFDSQILHNLNH